MSEVGSPMAINSEVPERELGLKVPLAVGVGVGTNWNNAKGDD